MKAFVISIIILIFPVFLFAQQIVSMEQCWKNAHDNMPAMKQKSILMKLDSLEQSILSNNYLPTINANAQTSWQSDVIGIDIGIPNINIDKPSQDQYKVFLEINQLIWDGGRTKAMKTKSKVESNLQKAQTEKTFNTVKQQVSGLYFGLMLSQKQMRITKKLLETLQKKLYELQSSVEQGIMLESNYNVLAAEKLNAKQRLTEQVQQSTAIVDMLNVITNMTITTNDSLEVFEPKKIKTCNRQQLHVFELQQKSFDAGKLALQKNRMPLFSAFTQVGYGKPGLNMLKNEADSYLLAGARISWNIFDWNTTKRQQQKLTYKQEMIEAQKEQFLQQVETQTQQYLSDIEKYETLLLRDNKIIKLRQKITEDYSSRLKQGTVTSSAYVDELFKEKTARITKEIHAIKLIQSHTALQIILEK